MAEHAAVAVQTPMKAVTAATSTSNGRPCISRLGDGTNISGRPARPGQSSKGLNRATDAALSSPQMKEHGAARIAPSLGSVKDFEAFIADEASRWAKIVKASGTQID